MLNLGKFEVQINLVRNELLFHVLSTGPSSQPFLCCHDGESENACVGHNNASHVSVIFSSNVLTRYGYDVLTHLCIKKREIL